MNKDSNAQVIDLIKGRLDLGQEKYGQSIPIRGEGGRDNLKESLEEVLDLAVYLGATLLELQAEKEKQKKETTKNLYRVDVQDIRLILRGLHYLQEEAYRENQLQVSKDILDLINGIKAGAKWNHEDDKGIGQTDNPMHELPSERIITDTIDEKGIRKPYTNCIEGSNCD